MTPDAFRKFCERMAGDPYRASEQFNFTLEEYDVWVSGKEKIPLSVSRALRYNKPVPRVNGGRILFNPGPNTKGGVRTPERDFPTVHAAAEAHGLTHQAAYRRALRKSKGWAFVPWTKEEASAFWQAQKSARMPLKPGKI